MGDASFEYHNVINVVGHGGRIVVENKYSDSGAKDTFSTDLWIKIPVGGFCIMDHALILYLLELYVEDILNHIVLIFRRSVSVLEYHFDTE